MGRFSGERKSLGGGDLPDRCPSLLRHELVLGFGQIRFYLFLLVALLLDKLLLQ